MDKRPIGIFDSGLGGLTCVPALRQALPNEKFIYFGDTARTPYGSKDPETIRAFASQIADFLVKSDVKIILIACNTVSSICLTQLQKQFPRIPIIDIISPAVDAIASTCPEGTKLGVIATKVTIQSDIYAKMLKKAAPSVQVSSLACPLFVPLIEEGIVEGDIMDLTIRHYLDGFIAEKQIDTLVLACTHYPLIRRRIEALYPGLRIINPSETVVPRVVKVLNDKHLLSDGNSLVENTFYASDLSENFVNMINRIFLNEPFKVAFRTVDPDAQKANLRNKR